MKCCKCGMEMISLDFKGSPSIDARTARGSTRQGGTRAILNKDRSVIDRMFNAFRIRGFEDYGTCTGGPSSRARSASVPRVRASSSSGVVTNMLFVSPAAG